MTALMISRIKVKDPAKLQTYLAKVQAVAGPYRAEMVFRGTPDRVLNGDINSGVGDHGLVVVVQFPDAERLNGWFESDAYQDLVALREAAAEMHMTSYVPVVTAV